MDSSPNNLTPLQNDFLREWFSADSGFFLTGGAALVAFYGVRRHTDDIDLFTVSQESYRGADSILRIVCQKIGAVPTAVQTSPTFRRVRVARNDETTLVDLVLDTAPQIHSEKVVRPDGVVLDPPEEILANKIAAVVGRAEPRDFYDVAYLADFGFDVNRALEQASIKDGGVTNDSLVFVLQGIRWAQFSIPGAQPEERQKVVDFFQSWCRELALRLFPPESIDAP